MDPNATLREINDADTMRQAREFCGYLAAWLDRGGFAPDWTAYPKGARRFNLYRTKG
jgi:hypothetical protein